MGLIYNGMGIMPARLDLSVGMDLSNLISYWKLDEESGERADSHGSNNMSDGNTVTYVGGKVGNAADFTAAAAEYLYHADNADLSTGDIDFSLTFWVYMISEVADMDMVSKYETDGNDREYRVFHNDAADRIQFVVIADGTGGGANEAAAFGRTIAASTWYFIHVWHDAERNVIGFWQNDDIPKIVSYANGVHDGSSPLHFGALGRAALGVHLNGYMDEVSFWKRLLTDREHFQLYNSGAGLTYPLIGIDLTERPKYNGAYSWFSAPMSIRYSGSNDKTYIAWQEVDGTSKVSSYNHAANSWDNSYPLNYLLSTDDHTAASLLVRDSDSKLLAFYCVAGSTDMRLRISSNAEDVGAWGAEADLHGSIGATAYEYTHPIQLTGETNDPIYLFYCDIAAVGNRDIAYSKSTDDGGTWSAQQQVFDAGAERVYFHAVQNGTTRIDFVATDGSPNDTASSIYHFYYDNGNWYASDDSLLSTGTASLPLEPGDVTQVYDGSSLRAWNWDIVIDSGEPIIAFIKFQTTTDHRAMYARLAGGVWDVNEIVATGSKIRTIAETYYSGGIAINPDNVNEVYLSADLDGEHEIYRYTTSDGGDTWAQDEQLTTGSSLPNFRPMIPANPSPELKVYWIYGNYVNWDNFDTKLVTEPDSLL